MTPQAMQASKWLSIQALIEVNEMQHLLDHLGDIQIYKIGQVVPQGSECVGKSEFLLKYQQYITELKQGQIPDPAFYRLHFSAAWTFEQDHIFYVPVNETQAVGRVVKPVVQLQLHLMGYSAIENKFRPMVFGSDCIHWGVQFSFPQLYLNANTKQPEKVIDEGEFPNLRAYRSIQKWIRGNTLPTPFFVKNEKMNVPMRLGRQCFSWINHHPQLQSKEIKVCELKGETA